jgi:PII-like signaling protein
LRVYLNGNERTASGKPLHVAIVDKCRELQIAGATVLPAQEGFGGGPEIHRARMLSHDRPLVVQIVDVPENIDRLIPAVEALLGTGMLAVSDVRQLRVHK